MEKTTYHLPLAKIVMFLGCWPGYFGHDIGPAISFGGRINYLGSVAAVLLVAKSGAGSGSALDIDDVPGLDESLHAGRRDADPHFQIAHFLWYTEFHGGHTPLVGRFRRSVVQS